MLERPRLRRNLAVDVVQPDKLFITDGGRQSLVEGPVAVALAPLLVDGRPSAEIFEALAHIPIGAVMGTLTRLERLGYLTGAQVNGDAAAAAHWDAERIDPVEAAERCRTGSVSVEAVGDAGADAAVAALEASGLRVGDGPGLLVVVVEDHLAPGLEAINHRQLHRGQPWLMAKLVGEQLWLGPHLQPHRGACWACLAQRLEGNRQLERYLARKDVTRIGPGADAALPSTIATGAALLATEAQTLLAGGRSTRTDDAIVTVDLHTLETERHLVTRQPHCPACGQPPDPAASPRIDLQPRPKRYTDDGGHRTVGPDETFARLERHISPLTGAVSSVRRQTATDNGVAYSFTSGHNFALMQDSTYFLRKNLRGRSGGKGRTETQARVGAVCEAIERFNGVYRGDEPASRASYAAIAEEAVHPEELMLFSDGQYAGRDAWNQQVGSYHVVPARLPDELEIDWSAAWSLSHERVRHVPSGYLWYGHPDVARHFFCTTDANGSAAGNTVEEAILQGLMELVERDSVALWWYNRARVPEVDLDALNEPYVNAVREYYATLDRDVWMLDLTSDLGIPAYAGISKRHGAPVEDLLMGFGAHLDPHTAAMRALTELNQFLPAVNERRPDGTTNYWMDDPDAVKWWTTATLESEPYLLPAPDRTPVRAPEVASLSSDDIAEDVRRCVARLKERGMETLVVDQTRPDIDLAVVKVMVPGLRHFWRRLGPGRLYDVPVELGWLPEPVAEDALNPTSIFF